jgi:hypothetical protein
MIQDRHGWSRPSRSLRRYELAAMEERSSPRARLCIPARLRLSAGRSFAVEIQNLSTAGFCARAGAHTHPGSSCLLTLPDMEPMRASVVWWERGEMGCALERPLSPLVHDLLVARYRTAGDARDNC